jgi:hypothetical protein
LAAAVATFPLAGAGAFCLWWPWHRDAAATRIVPLRGGTMQTATVSPQWLRSLLGKRGGFPLEPGPIHVRQELIQAAHRRPHALGQGASETSLRVQPVPLSAGDQAVGRGAPCRTCRSARTLSAGGGQWRIGYTCCMAPQPTASAIFCRRCGYNLKGLSECRCAECGRAFDPANRRTYSSHPHAPLRRRLTRYAVAALTVALLLAGAGGFCLWWPWHRDAAAFRMVHLCGGTMQTTTVGPQWLRNLLGKRGGFLLDRAGPVCDLSHSLVTDSDLPALNGLSELQKLRLVKTAVTDVGLERLDELEGLRSLNLAETAVTDAGLPHLKRFKRLRELYSSRGEH